jgi:hypothetical protein
VRNFQFQILASCTQCAACAADCSFSCGEERTQIQVFFIFLKYSGVKLYFIEVQFFIQDIPFFIRYFSHSVVKNVHIYIYFLILPSVRVVSFGINVNYIIALCGA